MSSPYPLPPTYIAVVVGVGGLANARLEVQVAAPRWDYALPLPPGGGEW